MTTYRTIPDGAMFMRPDTARPEVVYVRRDARNYNERDDAAWCYGVGPTDPVEAGRLVKTGEALR